LLSGWHAVDLDSQESAMIDRYSAVEDEIRAQMDMAIRVLAPYARSSGPFHDWGDLRHAIKLALQYVERAELLADHKLPPSR
jgi:hypothetical protein